MSTRRRRWATPFPLTRLRWLAVACLTLATAGCGQFLGGMIEAVTGEKVTLPEERLRTVPRSVYLRGPTPGWEYGARLMTPYRLPRFLFEVDVFAGACPGLYLMGGEPDGPFGAQQVRVDLQLFEPMPSHVADPNYYRFGRVTLTGPPDPIPPGVASRMLARWGGACTSVGIPLLSLGRAQPYVLHR